MKWLAALKNLHKGWLFAWGTFAVGVILTFVMRDRPADLKVELMSKARVYDVHAEVPGLTIMFNGTNIRQRREVLTFYTVRISNPGGQSILQNMYDQTVPFGLEFTGGPILLNGLLSPTNEESATSLRPQYEPLELGYKIFPPDIVEASQKYLTKNAEPKEVEGRRIEINKLVLDPGDFLTLRILVLHREIQEPEVEMMGKIAGIPARKIELYQAPTAEELRKKEAIMSMIVIFAVFLPVLGFVFWGILVEGSGPRRILIKMGAQIHT